SERTEISKDCFSDSERTEIPKDDFFGLGEDGDSKRWFFGLREDGDSERWLFRLREDGGVEVFKNLLRGQNGRDGLLVKNRNWGRRVPGSKPNSTEVSPFMGPLHVKSYVIAKRPTTDVVWKFGKGDPALRHLTVVQNDEGPSHKIALALLQNGALIYLKVKLS
ncbi:hypothetical protein AVEN_173910-1, partial [Araneus ventricosus]